MKETQGNLIIKAKKGEFDVIAHGANCFCTMGAGIARSIRMNFPEAYQADCETKKGDISKLGSFSEAESNGIIVINAYTQYNYGRNKQHLNEAALEGVLKKIKEKYGDKRIGLPRIGCSLGGAKWEDIRKIFKRVFDDCDNVTVVSL